MSLRLRSSRAFAKVALAIAPLVLSAVGCAHSAKPPSPDILPIGRLGRWNGTTFTGVGPDSIGSGHLYVLVHGWAAGYQKAVNGFLGPGPLLAWYPQAVNGKGEQFLQVWLAPMAAALSQLDPAAVVVAYSWLDQSATSVDPLGARISESHTIPNGERLGAALTQAVAPDFRANGGRVHILGHSHGAKVATIASLNVEPRPDQLTLFDSVDTVLPLLVGADNHLVPYLQRLNPGRTPGTTFVDNYFSEFGRAYGNEPGLDAIVDTSLDARQIERTNFEDRHLYPPRWYTAAANQPQAGVGPMWSPLLVDPPIVEKLAPYYVQAHPGDVSQQLVLRPATRPPRPSVETFVEHWWLELVAAVLGIVVTIALMLVARGRRRRKRRRRRAERSQRKLGAQSA